MKFLKDKEIDVMEWLPLSPDLNIIENIWAVMSRTVFQQGQTY